MTGTYQSASTGALDAAIAAGAYEAVALRLALGVLAALDRARAGAAGAREDLLTLMSELGDGR